MNRYHAKSRVKPIRLSPELYARVEVFAKEQGVTVKAVVEAAVADIGKKG